MRGSWYAREAHRRAIDLWQHGGISTRCAAEIVRALVGYQERWLLRRPLDPVPAEAAPCHLSPATVVRETRIL